MRRAALLAVDGGGSKLDAALVRRDGTVVATARVAATRYDQTGDDSFLDQIDAAVTSVARRAGMDPQRRPVADLGAFCLAGADLPQDDRRIARGLRERGFAERSLLRNDTFAVLRAGSERSWGIAIVCGNGTNCLGVAPNGRTYRLPAVGPISGDFGGGAELGAWSLWHAVRAEDGRGPATALRRAVPEHFQMRRPSQIVEALYVGRIDEDRLGELAPVLFEAAGRGDEVSTDLVNRQADEIATMAIAAARRLRMTGMDPDVVLGGGVFRTRWRPFHDRIHDRIHEVIEQARIVRLATPPVIGAVMLGLDELGAGGVAHARARASLTHAAFGRHHPRSRR